jgi:inorganic triphosphatase YgiF
MGVVLRVRSREGRWIQTVKTAGKASGGFHHRGEFESPVPDANPDYARLVSEHQLTLFSDPGLQERLRPVFETDFWRTSLHLNLPCGSVVELCLDSGEVKTDSKSTPICEIELELKQGRPEVLYKIALEIAGSVYLRMENISKAERGYALLCESVPEPVRKIATDVQARMTVEDVYAAILEGSLAQIQANELVILETDNPEGVHQMRVGLRRFRTCLSLFQKWVPAGCRVGVRDDINVFNVPLGAARDWDVFLENHRPYEAALDRKRDDWRELLAAAGRRRGEQVRALRDTLESPKYHLAMLRLSAWVHCREWRNTIEPERLRKFQAPLGTQIDRLLARGHRRIHRRYDKAQSWNPEALHRLRIAVKKQRYAVEFFRRMYSSKRVKKYRRAVLRLQELLGRLNDASVTGELLRNLEPGEETESTFPYTIDFHDLMFAAYLGGLPDAWKRFTRQRRFWE